MGLGARLSFFREVGFEGGFIDKPCSAHFSGKDEATGSQMDNMLARKMILSCCHGSS